jgi:predicted DNA-binding transcriptional regulator YafY
MNDSAKLRRQLHLIRYLDKPYTYPSIDQLIDYLRDHDVNQTSIATVERDIKDIRVDYDITISYDRRRRGYYLDLPTDDEDISNFREFVRLLERRQRLEVLAHSGRSVARYIQLEQPDGFRGFDLMAPLWNALQRKLVITFDYQAYKEQPTEKRRVEPGLLFEYRNRWYLDGYDLDRTSERTFGLDRIIDLTLTPYSILPSRQTDYRAARRHVIGVTAPPGSPVEQVLLRFRRPEAEYVLSLPLHNSQQTLSETPTYVDVELQVVVNHELEREILAYGEEVEVLEPMTLRKRIASRYRNAVDQYGS